jgi:ABC-type nitrate/sulfonate/bicarbonate transport system permease component
MMPNTLRKLWIELALPAVLFALLYVLSANSSNFYFPALSAVLKQFNLLWLGPRFAADVIPSLERLTAGYLLACIAGITLGVPIGLYKPLRRAVEPVLEFFRAVPPVAMIPLLIVSMGFGNNMKITVIVAGAIWPILLNTVEGVKGADLVLSETCKTYGIHGFARIRHFIIPSASPQIIVGMRLGLSIGIVLMVISEMFAALDGLGSAIIYFQRSYEIPQMWSGVLMLGLFGFSLSIMFRWFERWVLHWYYGMRNLDRNS